MKGNLLDHWECEVNNFGGGNQERQMYVDSQEFHLIVNLAVGGGFVGTEPEPGWQQSDMRIRNLEVETAI